MQSSHLDSGYHNYNGQRLNCIYHSCREVLWTTLTVLFLKPGEVAALETSCQAARLCPVSRAAQGITVGKTQAAKRKGGGTSLRP